MVASMPRLNSPLTSLPSTATLASPPRQPPREANQSTKLQRSLLRRGRFEACIALYLPTLALILHTCDHFFRVSRIAVSVCLVGCASECSRLCGVCADSARRRPDHEWSERLAKALDEAGMPDSTLKTSLPRPSHPPSVVDTQAVPRVQVTPRFTDVAQLAQLASRGESDGAVGVATLLSPSVGGGGLLCLVTSAVAFHLRRRVGALSRAGGESSLKPDHY
eukprot:SAG11_NODE_2693_length_3090_cov_1.761953_4_plen_221_part_00